MADLKESHGRFWADIDSRTPDRVAKRAGADVEESRILLPMAGRRYAVDVSDRSIRVLDSEGKWAETGFLESVVLVTYLATADGFPPAGEWVSEKGLTHGDVYFRPPHYMPTDKLARRFGADPDTFVAAASALGGTETGMADRGIEIPALPRVPVRFNLWLGDDEFPDADVRTMFDRNATHYLILDGILALANVIVKAMIDAAENRS